MLQQLATQNRGEVLVRVWEAVLLGIEKVDVAGELLAAAGCCMAMLGHTRRPVIAASDFAVTQPSGECRRDLKIGAHLQDAVLRSARRNNGERFFEARQVSFDVLSRTIVRRPRYDVLRLHLHARRFFRWLWSQRRLSNGHR